jgi:hypothetical protein
VSQPGYVVTCLFLPCQTGEANSCEPTEKGMMDASEICIRDDLQLLGWIHVRDLALLGRSCICGPPLTALTAVSPYARLFYVIPGSAHISQSSEAAAGG